MERDFWHARWQQQEIGFHEAEPNELLMKHVDCLGLRPGERVFVPLCGKSLDMHWLSERGYRVLGCELSPIAVGAFYAERGRAPHRVTRGNLEYWQDDQVSLFCGDIFHLSAGDLDDCRAVYDRAALIALPAEMRRRYAEHLRSLLPAGARSLLITLEYPQPEMDGPPFSVSADEVAALFAQYAEIRCLSSHDRLDDEPRFRERGLSRLVEHAFCLTWR